MKGLTATLVVAAAGIGYVLLEVEIPRIVQAPGYAVPALGVVRVLAPVAGTLEELFVSEGQPVQAGQLLARVNAQRSAQGGFLEARQATLVQDKRALAWQALVLTRHAADATIAAMAIREDGLALELSRLEDELEMAQQRLALQETQYERQRQLALQGFISGDALEQRRLDLIDQRVRVSLAERSRLSTRRELEALHQDKRGSQFKASAEARRLASELKDLDKGLNDLQASTLDVVAPTAGRVTQLSLHAGEPVRPEVPVLALVPLDSTLEIRLLVPSRSIGFVRAGQRVSLKYQAFPHAQYGRQAGVVRQVAAAALAPQDIQPFIKLDEPTYSVRVSVNAAHLAAGGRQWPITPGMLVDADIELDRPKVYQWVFEPLLRLGGRLHEGV